MFLLSGLLMNRDMMNGVPADNEQNHFHLVNIYKSVFEEDIMEHSYATQTAPSITDATYTVMRELRESQGSGSGTSTHEPTDCSSEMLS